MELWWENGGEFPVWAGLVQHADVKACYQRNLNYGGAKDVYLGSADNGANPTKKALRETVAILASARAACTERSPTLGAPALSRRRSIGEDGSHDPAVPRPPWAD